MQVHGGDIYNNQVDLDFSANINPFGMPRSIEEAAIQGVRESMHYPDINCNALRDAIASKEGIHKEHIICGNGAADLIFSLAQALRPEKALLIAPTFIEYEQALNVVDCDIQIHSLGKETGFSLGKDFLEKLDDSIDIVFLCNPNNPTGEIIQPELLDEIMKRCNEHQIMLVIDECFQDFLDIQNQDQRTCWLEKSEYLFLLRAFTKMYSMAGLRLGYGMTANEQLLKKMKLVSQPWNVSIPAQFAGIAACKEEAFAKRCQELIAKERANLVKEIRKLGFEVYGSKANFIFFEGSKGLYEECLSRRVLIRSCSNYRGLGNTFYRIAVKGLEENRRLIIELQDIVKLRIENR